MDKPSLADFRRRRSERILSAAGAARGEPARRGQAGEPRLARLGVRLSIAARAGSPSPTTARVTWIVPSPLLDRSQRPDAVRSQPSAACTLTVRRAGLVLQNILARRGRASCALFRIDLTFACQPIGDPDGGGADVFFSSSGRDSHL